MKTNVSNAVLIILIVLFSLVAYLSFWYVETFGNVEFGQIVFHAFMPLKQAPADWAKNIWFPFVPVFFNVFGILYVWRATIDKNNFILILSLISFIIFDCWYTNKHFHILDFVKAQIRTSNFIEKHYINPKTQKIIFPENKKNLIFLMIESLESSYQDKKNGGLFNNNYIPELTHIAKNNISFSHSDNTEGAIVPPECNWTVAATVAQTAGIPLKIYGDGNSMSYYQYFLPHAFTLGDILLANGYDNYALFNTDARYGGISDYLEQHGQYLIKDTRIIGNISDEKLFEVAKKDLQNISQKTPFSLLVQTMDTHFGRLSDFKKTSKAVADFLAWVQEQPFFENTVIVISGDHCNMNHSDFKNLKSLTDTQRKVYVVFVNSSVIPHKMTHRQFSTLDMFPTILAALGADLEQNRLGLGTNLFSEEKTLFEQYNTSFIFDELKKRSPYYNRTFLYK